MIIQRLETQLQQGWTDSGHQEWDESRRELVKVEAWENELLCSKVRLNWAPNSKFFHAIIRDRRNRHMIQPELDNGEVTTAPSKIGRNAVSYFSDLFTASPYHLDANLFDTIDPCIPMKRIKVSIGCQQLTKFGKQFSRLTFRALLVMMVSLGVFIVHAGR